MSSWKTKQKIKIECEGCVRKSHSWRIKAALWSGATVADSSSAMLKRRVTAMSQAASVFCCRVLGHAHAMPTCDAYEKM